MRPQILAVCFAALLKSACSTGSNFEKLRENPPDTATAATLPLPGTYAIAPFTFTPAEDRSDMFRKAFLVPGYKGIDFDGYGRLAESDRTSGMKTLYTLSDAHTRIASELARAGMPADSEAQFTVQTHIESSEAAMRMHTYGCWPFVGFFVYLVNGNVYTVIFRTRLTFTISGGKSAAKMIRRDILTESTFGFWSTYAGFDLLESFEAGLDTHVKQIAADLEAQLRQAP